MYSHLGDAVKWIKYHGHGRERNLESLSKSDIVLTTYNTLATDAAAKKSPLHSLGWFRVVLDEGASRLPGMSSGLRRATDPDSTYYPSSDDDIPSHLR